MFNDDQQEVLKKMIEANGTKDFTSTIRELKNSHKIQYDINNLLKLKHHYNNNKDLVLDHGKQTCSFLYDNYTEIFNNIVNDKVDLGILNQFLNVLRAIEDGKMDQHEGSYVVGSMLKERFVDSALQKNHVDNSGANENLTWSEYKKKNL